MKSRMTTGVGILSLCLGAVSAVAGCGEDSNSIQVMPSAGGADRFPSHRLMDWVSYADHLAVVHVVSDERVAPPREVTVRGEGYVGRSATLRIERTIWSATGAPSAPSETKVFVSGWMLKDGAERRVAFSGGPRFEIGGKYVMTLTRYKEGGWGLLAPGTVFHAPGDPIASADVARTGVNPVAKTLAGKSLDEVTAIMNATAPNPFAVKYWSLPPDERFQAAATEELKNAPQP